MRAVPTNEELIHVIGCNMITAIRRIDWIVPDASPSRPGVTNFGAMLQTLDVSPCIQAKVLSAD
jgi:hypothetical protein